MGEVPLRRHDREFHLVDEHRAVELGLPVWLVPLQEVQELELRLIQGVEQLVQVLVAREDHTIGDRSYRTRKS